MAGESVSVLDGNVFAVSDRRGDMEGQLGDEHGLFRHDTRFLSRSVLTLDGKRPNVLSIDDTQYFKASFFMTLSTGTIYVDSFLSVVRQRTINTGFHEDLTLINHGKQPMDLVVVLEAGADFADLFEVKDQLPKKGELYRRADNQLLVLGYRRERFSRETWIRSSEPAEFSEGGLRYRVHLPAHGSWATCIAVDAVSELKRHKAAPFEKHAVGAELAPALHEDVRAIVAAAPRLSSHWEPLQETYRRSLLDLAALRFRAGLTGNQPMPAAGLPWFMAMFGRDSLITSFQALPFLPELAATTLRVLSAMQARTNDPFRDAEPGKIPHELRFGELTAFEERPHSPYYGSADSTPLFLVLLDEYERWTGDHALVTALERPAREAIRWINESGDRDGDGYVEYERRNKETGLENQCWKDSGDSIAFASGELAPLPRATCEIQGYVYDAKVRTARLARRYWHDSHWAEELEREAEELKERFNRDFWIAERKFFALALDGKKRKVDSLTSNIGHLLWSGIVEPDKVEPCVRHLMDPRTLFSGWGVRTMAKGEGSFNPIGYHVGTVWPHDSSIVAWGLRKAGHAHEAARVALAVLEAAVYFRGRLPEAFAGYDRGISRFPVEYPTACSPQAWASGAPLLMLRTLLGLDAVEGHLVVEPLIPVEIGRVELLDVPGRWGHADAFGRTRQEAEPAPTSLH